MSDIQSNIQVNIDTTTAVAELKNLQRQISTFHTQMAQAGAASAASATNLQRNLVNSINASGKFTASFKTVTSSTEAFTTALESNKLSMTQYFRYAGGATKTFGRLFKSEFDTIGKVSRERVKDLQTQYIKLGRDANGAMKAIAIRPTTLDMKDLGTQTQIAAQRQALLNQLLRQGSTQLLNFGKNTQWAGRQLMVGFTVPLMYLGTAASKAFMDIEREMIRFKRVYGDFSTSQKEINDMGKQLMNVASQFTKYGVAIKDTMSMAADAAATGKTGADLIAQVTEATRLSVLGFVDQQEALQTTISLTNAFGIASQDLAKKTDFLNAVENQTVLSIQDLTVAIPKAGPVVKQLGGSVEDLAFFMTAMKEGGINASEGANALKSGLAAMINPTKKASEMLAGYGINIKGIVEANRGDLKGTVIGFAQALNQLKPLERARAIEQLFGKFQFARISTLFKNITEQGTQAQRTLELTRATSAQLAILSEREMKQTEQSPMFKFKKAVEDLKKSLAPVGEVFLKTVTPVINFFKDLLDKFNNLDEGTKTIITRVVAVVAGLGPVVLMTIGLIANGVANLIKLFAGIKSFFNRTGAGSKFLGDQVKYLTEEQIQAEAVASSLDQAHAKLTQRFTSEAEALQRLITLYRESIIAQSAFPAMGGAVAGRRARFAGGKKSGDTGGVVTVPGPAGAGDVVPAMVSPQETIISAANSKKYAGLIEAIRTDSVPGYATSKPARQSRSRVGSGREGSFGKSGVTLVRQYGANVSNTAGLVSFTSINPKNMADLTSIYTKEILQKAGVSANAIVKEIKQWEVANRTAIDAATQAVQAGIPAEIAFEDLVKKFAIDMEKSGGAFSKFAAVAKEEAPKLEKDLVQAQEMAKELNLNMMKAADVSALYAALPENKVAQGMMKPGRYQSLSRIRAGVSGFFGGVAGIGTHGIPRFMITPGLEPGSVAYKAATSQEHFNVTKQQEEHRAKVYNKKSQATAVSVGSQAAKQTAIGAGVKSPSVITDAIGKDIDRGLQQGMLSMEDDVAATGAQVGKTAATAVGKGASQAKLWRQQQGLARQEMRLIDQIPAKRMAMLRAAETMAVPGANPRVAANIRKTERLRIQAMGDEQILEILKQEEAERVTQAKAASAERAKINAQSQRNAARLEKEAAIQREINAQGDLLNAESGYGAPYGPARPTKMQSLRSKMAMRRIAKTQQPKQPGVGMAKFQNTMMMASMLPMMASFLPGAAGQKAQQYAMPLMGLTMALSMIQGPISAVAVGFGLLALAVWKLHDNVNKAQESGREFAKSLSMSTDKMIAFSKATGKVSATEEANKTRQDLISSVGMSKKTQTFGENILNSDFGKTLMADVQKQMSSEATKSQVGQNIGRNLSYAIMQGVITEQQAKAISVALGKKLGNYALSVSITGEITNLFGPNGENLKKDPLLISVKLQEDSVKEQANLFSYALNNSIESNTATNIGLRVAGTLTAALGAVLTGAAWATAGLSAIPGVALMTAGTGMYVGGRMDENKRYSGNMERGSAAVQLGLEQVSQNQDLVDAYAKQMDLKIQELEKQKALTKDTEKRKKLEKDILDLQAKKDAGMKTLNQKNDAFIKSLYSQTMQLTNGQEIFNNAIAAEVDLRYKDSGAKKVFADEATKALAAMGQGKTTSYLQIQLATGGLDPVTVTTLIDMMNTKKGSRAIFDKLVADHGAKEVNTLIQMLNASGVSAAALPALFEKFSKDPNWEKDFAALQQIVAVASSGLDINMNVRGAEKITAITKLLDNKKTNIGRKFVEDFLAKNPGLTQIKDLLANWDQFENKKGQINKKILISVIAGGDTNILGLWAAATGTDLSKLTDKGQEVAMKLAAKNWIQKIKNAFKALTGGEDGTGTKPPTSGDSGGTGTNAYQDALKALIDQKKAILDAAKAYDKLRKAGFSAAAAIRLSKDSTLAAGLAFTNNAKQVKELVTRMKELDKLTHADAQDVLNKELENMDKKDAAQQKINDSLQKEIDLKNKLMELNISQTQAKISGDYLGAALIGQQKLGTVASYNADLAQQATNDKRTRIQDILTKLQNGDKVSWSDIQFFNSIAAGQGSKVKIGKTGYGQKNLNYATGGLIKGPGTSTSDSIKMPIVGYAGGGVVGVSTGEFVHKASAVNYYGTGFMNAVNNQQYDPTQSGSTVYNIEMNITGSNADEISRKVLDQIKLLQQKSNGGNRINA